MSGARDQNLHLLARTYISIMYYYCTNKTHRTAPGVAAIAVVVGYMNGYRYVKPNSLHCTLFDIMNAFAELLYIRLNYEIG